MFPGRLKSSKHMSNMNSLCFGGYQEAKVISFSAMRNGMVGMASDLVEATPKGSDDCLLDMKPGWPADALEKVGEAGSAARERNEGEGQRVWGRTFKGYSQEGSDLSDTVCLDLALGEADL